MGKVMINIYNGPQLHDKLNSSIYISFRFEFPSLDNVDTKNFVTGKMGHLI